MSASRRRLGAPHGGHVESRPNRNLCNTGALETFSPTKNTFLLNRESNRALIDLFAPSLRKLERENPKMKNVLSAADTKIQRARKHLAELEAEVGQFVASRPVKFEAETIENGGGRSFNFRMHMAPVSDDLGAIVGDVIHNLRAALDLTAAEMVRRGGGDDKNVYFPFCENAEDLDGVIRQRNFDKAGDDAVALLQTLKPYRNGNVALRVIYDLDIHDKHRALTPNAMSAASPVIRMWDDDGRINPQIIGDPAEPSEIKIMFPDEVALQGRELIPTLHELVQLVEEIVEAFRNLPNKTDDDGVAGPTQFLELLRGRHSTGGSIG